MSPRYPRRLRWIPAIGAATIAGVTLIGGHGPVSGAEGRCPVMGEGWLPGAGGWLSGGSGNGNGNGNRGSFNGNGNSGNGNGNGNLGSGNGNLNGADCVGNGYIGNGHDNLVPDSSIRPPPRPFLRH